MGDNKIVKADAINTGRARDNDDLDLCALGFKQSAKGVSGLAEILARPDIAVETYLDKPIRPRNEIKVVDQFPRLAVAPGPTTADADGVESALKHERNFLLAFAQGQCYARIGKNFL